MTIGMCILTIFCYIFVAYGACNVIAFGSGPFRVFERLRAWSSGISEHFGMLFSCMMCLPANFGWIFSLVNWFLIPMVAITPFNIILGGYTSLWWLAALCDGAFTTAVVYLIYVIDDFFEKKNEIMEKELLEDTWEE
jgi:hypothetical protein